MYSFLKLRSPKTNEQKVLTEYFGSLISNFLTLAKREWNNWIPGHKILIRNFQKKL